MKSTVIIELTEDGVLEDFTVIGDIDVLCIDWEDVDGNFEEASRLLGIVAEIKDATPDYNPATVTLIRIKDRLTEIVDDLAFEGDDDGACDSCGINTAVEDGLCDECIDEAESEDYDDEFLSVDEDAHAKAGDEEDRSV